MPISSPQSRLRFIPGFAAIVGAAPTPEIAKAIAEEYQQKNLYVFMAANQQGTTFTEQLIEAGVVVITVGGGGIPVVADRNGDLHGVPAVIDKDLASALLANEIGADMLIISTAVEKVALRFGTPDQEWVDRFTLAEVKQYLDEGGHFAEGSMAPKMRAVVQFLEAGGKEALITNPENLERAMAGEMMSRSASSSLASNADARSLSITAATP